MYLERRTYCHQKDASNKVPGPDGYTVEFFRATWKVVGDQVVASIQEFFIFGRLLKKLNATAITLVPKCPHPK